MQRDSSDALPAVYTTRLSTQLAIYAHGGWGRGCADNKNNNIGNALHINCTKSIPVPHRPAPPALAVTTRLCQAVSSATTPLRVSSQPPTQPACRHSPPPCTFHRMLRVWLNLNKFNKHKLFAAAAALFLATLCTLWKLMAALTFPTPASLSVTLSLCLHAVFVLG